MSRLYNKGPFPRSKSPNIGHPSRVTMEDHSFKSNDPNRKGTQGFMGTKWLGDSSGENLGKSSKMEQENRRKKQQIRSQQMARLFSGIKFNFGGKGEKGGKEDTRDITTGNNVRSGGGQRYTKPDTLYR